MGKLHKTLRVEEETAARVSLFQEEGESEAATYNRVILAGLDALEGAGSGEEAAKGGNDSPELVRSLSEHIDTLKAELEAAHGELAIKNGQIEALTNITKAAQTLQGLAHKQLTEGEPIQAETPLNNEEAEKETEKRGFFARLFG